MYSTRIRKKTNKQKAKQMPNILYYKRANVLKYNFLYRIVDNCEQTFVAPLNYANIFKASV